MSRKPINSYERCQVRVKSPTTGRYRKCLNRGAPQIDGSWACPQIHGKDLRSIKDAPKDGTLIIGVYDGREGVTGTMPVYWDAKIRKWCSISGPTFKPSFWWPERAKR